MQPGQKMQYFLSTYTVCFFISLLPLCLAGTASKQQRNMTKNEQAEQARKNLYIDQKTMQKDQTINDYIESLYLGKSVMTNPFPNVCVEKSNMSDHEIETVNLCILRQKWENDIRISETHTDSLRRENYEDANYEDANYEEASYLLKYLEPRVITKEDGDQHDCLINTRKTTRSAPQDCYDVEFITDANKLRHSWMNFYGEIRPDFHFTFDFVLYNKLLPERKENQFWYLILYLKVLASILPNPVRLLEVVRDRTRQKWKELRRKVLDLAKKMMEMYTKAVAAAARTTNTNIIVNIPREPTSVSSNTNPDSD